MPAKLLGERNLDVFVVQCPLKNTIIDGGILTDEGTQSNAYKSLGALVHTFKVLTATIIGSSSGRVNVPW